MLVLNDYICENSECPLTGLVTELLWDTKEKVICCHCDSEMLKLVGAPVGWVQGTLTPCRPRQKK